MSFKPYDITSKVVLRMKSSIKSTGSLDLIQYKRMIPSL